MLSIPRTPRAFFVLSVSAWIALFVLCVDTILHSGGWQSPAIIEIVGTFALFFLAYWADRSHAVILYFLSTAFLSAVVSIAEWWEYHRKMLRVRRHHNRWMQADWDRYGEDAFAFQVLEIVTDTTRLLDRERWWQDRDYDAARRYNPPNITKN